MILGTAACAHQGAGGPKSFDTVSFHHDACSKPRQSDSKWNIRELYDCGSGEMFIPYQLWSAAKWHGDKNAACMHIAASRFNVNETGATTISGPQPWQHPDTGQEQSVWVRKKADGSKTQYFTCHERGIGRVFDSRRSRIYETGRCKFPGGGGWVIGQQRKCTDTAIEIVGLTLDHENNLETLTFKWWTGFKLDHIYRYAPNKGMLNAWPQRQRSETH